MKQMTKLKVTLLTGRTINQGTGKEHGKLSKKYMESVAICQIDPEDLKKLEIREGKNVRVTTAFGSVVLKAVKSLRAPHPHVIFVPYGPWANALIGSETSGVGMPTFKGIPAEVETSQERIVALPELLKQQFGRSEKTCV
jgi:formylmethanofuran dehydrogenase subunit D